MPIYEYKCDKCGVFEVTQRITENALKKCPTCKSKVERIISNTSFVLKGSGWYITDYGRGGKTSGGESSNDSSKSSSDSSKSSGDSSSSTSEPKASDSKPAEKSA
ncbi:MAG TPA: zinc ribbon domain-containing protein [Candidatus Binataceae bacterium]|nr:zinc ribbon domain-containing protein [Candidatus Binataceae bacterium]